MNKGAKLTPKLIEDLASAYKQGKTTPELAAEYKMSKATVCRALRQTGIEPERKDNLFTGKEFPPEKLESLLLEFRSGTKIADLMEKYEESYLTIFRALEANGLVSKNQKRRQPTRRITKVIQIGENIRKILSEEEKQEICQKYLETSSMKQDLADEYQVHVDTIGAILRKNSILTKRFVPEEIIDAFCEEYETGVSTITELATIYKLNPVTVRYWLTKRGLLDKTDQGPNVSDAAKSPAPLSTAALRKLAKERSPRMVEILTAIAEDPEQTGRTRITAAQLLVEIGHGKARETPEEEKETQSTTAKILSLVPNVVKDKIKK